MKTRKPDQIDTAKRAFVERAGVVVPPAMVMLLSTSMSSPAIAASGRGGSSDLPLLGLLPIGFAGVGGPLAAAPAAPPIMLAAAEPGVVPAPAAPVFSSNAAETPPVAAVAPNRRDVLVGDPKRSNQIARAGERG